MGGGSNYIFLLSVNILHVCMGKESCRQEHANGSMWMGVSKWEHVDGSVQMGAWGWEYGDGSFFLTIYFQE